VGGGRAAASVAARREDGPGGEPEIPSENSPHPSVLVGGVRQRRSCALGWYRPSVGVPRDVGRCALVVFVAYIFSVQFSTAKRNEDRPASTARPNMHADALAPRSTAARITSVLDSGAAVLFAAASWQWSRVLLPTHMRPYPGTNVSLPDGSAQLFVRDPQHLLTFVPDSQSSVGKVALQSLVVASVLVLAVLAHCSRREAPVAVACMCWAIGLTELVTNPAKNYVGRLRPQFYTSCGWDEQRGACTWDPAIMPDPKFLPLDARHSFPSEHSSLAMCAGLILTLYALRILRNSGAHAAGTPTAADTAADTAAAAADAADAADAAAAAAASSSGPRAEAWRHVVGLFAYRLLTPLALVPACFAVWVGASRVHDNWHHPSDVATGLLLGG
jgi:membrane-associated phospholipid phosphatase